MTTTDEQRPDLAEPNDEQTADTSPSWVGAHAFAAPGQAWEDDEQAGPIGPLFTGDTGQLPEDVRSLLVTLLRKRYISAEANPREWQLLAENEPALRTRMHDLFLELVVNREYEVAFKQQVPREGGEKFPTLLYDKAYSREETVALVQLRRELRARQQAGQDSAFIDRADLLDEIARHRPESETNLARDTRAAANAIENLITMDLLIKTEQPDRFRIPSVLEVLLPVAKLTKLEAWLAGENSADATGATADPEPDDAQASIFDLGDGSDHDTNTPDDAPEDLA